MPDDPNPGAEAPSAEESPGQTVPEKRPLPAGCQTILWILATYFFFLPLGLMFVVALLHGMSVPLGSEEMMLGAVIGWAAWMTAFQHWFP